MRNRGQVVFGLIVILIGVSLLIGNVFRIDVGKFFWPVVLILVGVWLLTGARLGGPGRAIEQRILGEIRREGHWQVKNEEFWCLVGEIELDMSAADIPLGETRLRTLGFVGEVELLEQRFPGIAGQVEMVDVATPLTFERYTGNWKGTFEGWLITPQNAHTMMNPMSLGLPGLQNFYMCGQWVQPGGGLPTGVMSGRRLVQALCKEDSKEFQTSVGGPSAG